MSHASFFRLLLGIALASVLAPVAPADPLSRKKDVDFFRQVASRNLHGIATRSDGRLVAGPVLTDLAGPLPAELVWCLEPVTAERWLVGTGPEGRIFEVTLNPAAQTFTSREVAKLKGSQVFALRPLPDGGILAGGSPKGELALIQNGKVTVRASLPADSIFDLLLIPAGPSGGACVLAATGNPARIYRIDLKKFSGSGGTAGATVAADDLAAHGITLFGSLHDRNVRRIARLSDGRIAAGSSPKGNVYVFPAPATTAPPGAGPEAAPLILDENHNAEVTDLLPQANGDFLAAIVTNGSGDFRSTIEKAKDSPDLPPRAEMPTFGGRGVLGRFTAAGSSEALLSRSGTAFYRLAQQGGQILIAGGEEGDFTGYDLDQQMALTFAGSQSARLIDLKPIPGAPGRFLILRNNAPGLARVDFQGAAPREVETHSIDLGAAGRIGAIRFDRLRDLEARQVQVEIRTSYGSDEVEGWSAWKPLASEGDGWRAPDLRGRYVKLRVRLPAEASSAEVDRAAIYFLPQNRRPELQDFHFISPNYSLVPQPEPAPAVIATLAQLMVGKDDDKRKSTFLASQVVPSPGAQVAFWTVTDPDGDNVVCTFSIRREGDSKWTDLAVNSRDNYVDFDTARLPDGIYFTRLVAKETAPRPEADRLSVTFETDDLVVDHTPPEILTATAVRRGDAVVVSVSGRDALSLLDGIEVHFNNGDHQTVEQPADGIRDGREETFILEEPAARTTGATALDVTLYDSVGNAATRRLELPPR